MLDVGSVCDGMLAAFAVHCVLEFDVRIVQHGEDIIGGACDFAHLRHDGFFLFAHDVLLLAKSVTDGEFISAELRVVFDKTEEGTLFNGEQFRREEGCGGGNVGDDGHGFVGHALIAAVGIVLVASHVSVDIDFLQFPHQFVARCKSIIKGFGAVPQVSGEFRSVLISLFFDLLQVGIDGVFVLDHCLDIPLVLRIDLVPCFQFFRAHFYLPVVLL